MRPKAGPCGFDEAMGLTLEERAERLAPARYADLPKTKKKPKATNGEMALFEAALVKLVESQTRAVNVRRVFYLAVSDAMDPDIVQAGCTYAAEGRRR